MLKYSDINEAGIDKNSCLFQNKKFLFKRLMYIEEVKSL